MYPHNIFWICFTIFLKLCWTKLTICDSSRWKKVASCPKNAAEWKISSAILNCSDVDHSCVYHCLRNEFQNASLEGCGKAELIVGKYCAEYNMHGRKIQANYELSCSEDPCPCPVTYLSNETFKYPSCQKLEKEMLCLSFNSSSHTKSEKASKTETEKIVWIVICSIETPCLLGCIIVIIYLRQRITMDKRIDDDTDKEQRQELLKTIRGRERRSSSVVGLPEPPRRGSVCSSIPSVRSTLSMEGLSYVIVFSVGENYTRYGFSVNKSDVPSQATGLKETCTEFKELSALLLNRDPSTGKIDADATRTLFGFEARESYQKLEGKERKSQLFFPTLNIQKKEEDLIVKDIKGNEEKAEEILKYFLSSLQKIASHRIKERNGNPDSENTNYVLVSKAWDFLGKEELLMNAALKSGIRKDKLKIIKEMDAYPPCLRQVKESILCLNSSLPDLSNLVVEDSVYIVIDISEGGVNIVINRVKANGADANELHEYFSWGDACISTRFMKKIFVGLLGKDCMDKLREEHYSKYVMLLEAIEECKRGIACEGKQEITFHLPSVLHDIVREKSQTNLQRVVETSSSKFAKYVKVNEIANSDIEISISAGVTHSELFQLSIEKLKHHIQKKSLKRHFPDIAFVYLIGSYANYILLQDVVLQYFNNLPVIIPSSPDLVVVKGAAFYADK